MGRNGDFGHRKIDKTDFGKRLKECRLSKGYSIQKVSDAVGISRNYYFQLENGDKTPSLDTFILLANYLNVTSDELLRDCLNKKAEIRQNLLLSLISTLSEIDQQHIETLLKEEISYIQEKK